VPYLAGTSRFASAGPPAKARHAVRGEPLMTSNRPAQTPAEIESDARARRRAQEAVQEAMDRRDNGGDGATITDN
jgi:hypothetical protein